MYRINKKKLGDFVSHCVFSFPMRLLCAIHSWFYSGETTEIEKKK